MLGCVRVLLIDLKEMDGGSFSKGTEKLEGWGKKNDAYVICRVSDDLFKRTKTVDEGGKNPTWNGTQIQMDECSG